MENTPKHIAIIMDGNGRWAQKQGQNRTYGHQNGVESVREAIKGCMEAGVQYLTLYAFSSENWNRPKEEVDFLMGLLVESITNELSELQKNNIRLETIGDISALPEKNWKSLESAKAETAANTALTLILALNYGARKELTNTVQQIAAKIANGELNQHDIDEATIQQYLYTSSFPDPEMMIRTSKEFRLSNFMLWQMAYTEFFFLDKFWPEFTRADIHDCIAQFQARERRFGKTSEQI